MSREPARLLLSVALALLAPAWASAEGEDPAPPEQATSEDRPRLSPELVARWRALSPENRRRLRRIYRDRLRSRSPEERQRLRQLARRHHGERGARGHRDRRGFGRLVQRLLARLTPEERAEIQALEGKARQARVRQLILEHRQAVLDKQLERLSGEGRQAVLAAVEGKTGAERLRLAKRALEEFVRERLQAVAGDPNLDADGRRQRLDEALQQVFPNARHRARMLRRLQERGAERPEGRWPGRRGPGARGAPGGPREGAAPGRRRGGRHRTAPPGGEARPPKGRRPRPAPAEPGGG